MRLGRIACVNCYPVYGAMDRGIVAAPATLASGTPSELNDRLSDERLDISVISAVAFAQHPGAFELLPDLAVSSDGPVRSVLLFSRKPPEQLGGARVLASTSSRTSVLLLDLLARERWAVEFRVVPAPAEAGDLDRLADVPHDAALVIGDGALLLSARGAYPHVVDLGQDWKEWTGLPFVFAVWAARRDVDRQAVRGVHGALLSSRKWGLAHLDDLADQAAALTGVDRAACRQYLSGLDYRLSHRHIAGLTDFLRRLAALGLVPEGSLSSVRGSGCRTPGNCWSCTSARRSPSWGRWPMPSGASGTRGTSSRSS